MVGLGLVQHRHRHRPSDRHAERRGARHGRAVDLPAAEGVRRRLRRPDRRRGDRQRRARVQAARGEERGQHDDGDGRPARASCSSGSRSSPTPTRSCRPSATSRRPCRSSRRASSATGTVLFVLFQASTALILFLAANTVVQRVPPARRDPRDRRLHAPPVRVPRRPPRVLLGDRPPGGGRRAPRSGCSRATSPR